MKAIDIPHRIRQEYRVLGANNLVADCVLQSIFTKTTVKSMTNDTISIHECLVQKRGQFATQNRIEHENKSRNEHFGSSTDFYHEKTNSLFISHPVSGTPFFYRPASSPTVTGNSKWSYPSSTRKQIAN